MGLRWLLACLLLAPAAQAWQAKIVGKYTGSFLTPGDESRSSSLSAIAEAVYPASPGLAIQATWGLNQKLEPLEEFTFTNPEFRVFYRWLGSKQGWSLSVGPTAALPLSQTSHDESLYFAVGAAARFAYDDQARESGGLLIYYDIGLNRNVHRYETSNSGTSNTQASLDHFLYAEYVFSSPLTADAWVGFSSAWSYLGVVTNNYTLGQELRYALSEHWEAAVGHERGGDFLSPNGQSYNFGLFDAQESRFYLAVTWKL